MRDSKLSIGLQALKWVAILFVGVVVIRYGGELVFYVPGLIAKRISVMLVGSSKGVVTTIFFYLVAATFVLVFAAIGWSLILTDKWLAKKRRKLQEPN